MTIGSRVDSLDAWAIKILTTEYLVDGYILPERDIFRWARQYSSTDAFECGPLTDVHVLPAGNLTTPSRSFPAWDLASCSSIVMLIPSDDASRAAAPKEYVGYRNPFPAVMYAGPYVVRATVMSDRNDIQMLFIDHRGFIPLTDAEIECQLPGSQVTALRVPWLLLNAGLLHGYSLL